MFFIFMAISASAVTPADIYESEDLCYAPNNIISGVEMTNMGDYVTFRALNNDPYVHLRKSTATITDKFILIKYRTTSSVNGQIYFKSAEPSVMINWNGNGEWNTVIVDATAAGANWTNKTIFRFDPLQSHQTDLLSCTIDVEYIGFFSSEADAIQYEQEREAEKELPEYTDSTFTFTKYGNGYGVSGCTTSENAIAIPETHGGLPVTYIFSGAFTNAERLKYLYIPPSVTSIQSKAFTSSTPFTLVGVAGSASETFAKSSGADFVAVTDPSDFIITVKNNAATIEGYNGTSADITLPLFYNGYKITSVGNGAFENNTIIRSVSVVYCIEIIGEHAFASSSLTSVALGESVKYISKAAFSECSYLSSVSMSNVKNIGDFAFLGCLSLTGINLPTSLESIGLRAFSITELKSITIPSNVRNIHRYAFLESYSLTSISVASSNSNFSSENGILYNSTKKTVYICPEGKTGTVTINSQTETIGRGAFINCDLISGVNISNVKTVNGFAFYDCDRLANVTVTEKVTTVNEYAFSECNKILVKCYIASEIQKHCSEYGINFEIMYTDYILGDANGDGVINGKDIVRLSLYINNAKTAIIKDSADIDGDGDIDRTDLIKLRDMFF